MIKKGLLSLLLLLTMVSQGAWAWDGSGTAEAPYQVRNADDWLTLVLLIGRSDTYQDYCDKYYILTNDITVSRMVGMGLIDWSTEGHMTAFKGNFDGGNHTITLELDVTKYDLDTPAAPFAALDGATIKNLNVAGSITTDGRRPAGIASFVSGNTTISNCKSSVAITSSYASDIDAGGFVGRVNKNGSLTMSGCIFTGSINYSNNSGYEGGGLVGWTQEEATSTLTDCVFAPTSVSIKNSYNSNFYMFAIGHRLSTININNCYYDDVAAGITEITKQGKRMRTISAGNGVTSLTISGEGTVYNVSGITGYETGIMYNSKYYAGEGDEVSLTLSHSAASSGNIFNQYSVVGGGSITTPNETLATLTMSDANQTIIAQYMMASCVEGPWTLQGMKTHVCANDGSSTSVSFNNMNNGTWNGTITPWKDGDGVGYSFEDSTPNPLWSTMGIFSTYLCEKTVTSYSSLKVTWTYQLRSKSTMHHSTTCIYARQGTYDDIKNMEVDFTNYHTSGKGFQYLVDFFTNREENGDIEKGSEKTTVIEFDNLDGSEAKTKDCYLLLAHVFASGDGQRSSFKEWGSFKNINYSLSWTYRKIITFDANGGEGTMSVQTIDGSKKLSPNCFYRAGYTFQGWATSPNGEKVYNDGQEVTATSDENGKGPVTLYAIWAPGESSSVSRAVGPWTLKEWRTMLCDAAANTTMTFNRMNNWCWGTLTAQNDVNGIGFAVTGSSPDNKKNAVFSIYGMTQSVPAYAKCRMTWGYQIGSRNTRHYSRVQLFENPDLESLKSMEVDFEVNGGSGYYPNHRLSYLYNNSFANQPAYSPEGTCDIEFDNLDGNSTANMSTYLMLTHESSSVSGQSSLNEQGLLKHLSRADNWTYRKIVSFDANGGAGMMADQMIDDSGTLTANTFTREGYTFAGWATAPNGAVGYTDGQEVTATSEDKGPVTLYAVWTPIAYTLSYELNGGAATNPATYTTAETLTLNAPTKADNTFIGWTGANGTVPQTSVAIIKGSTGEKTFTAHWMSNAVSATVALIDAIGEVTYPTSGAAITAARNAYDALSEADHALVANYGTLTAAEQTYAAARDAAGSKTIRFVNKDDETITEQNVGMNLEAPVIDGFTFDHWQVVEKNISDDQTIRVQAVYTSKMNHAPKVYTNPANPAQKLVRQGDVYILQDKEN